MQGFATILNEESADRLSEEHRDYLNRIGSVAGRMDQLITDSLPVGFTLDTSQSDCPAPQTTPVDETAAQPKVPDGPGIEIACRVGPVEAGTVDFEGGGADDLPDRLHDAREHGAGG